jgi:hypothetical protein
MHGTDDFTGEFHVSVNLGNDAMVNAYDLATALRKVAEQVENGDIGDDVRDFNGNTVGRWDLSTVDVCPVCGDPDHD